MKQATLPFPLEGHTASRDVLRANSKNVDHLRKVDLSRIRIREGFNGRRQGKLTEELYERVLMIPELAEGILISNGPAEPILGDFHTDGHFYITNGERRYRALRHLLATNRLQYPNGVDIAEVTVLLNPPGTTDLERKRKVITTQDNLKLKPMERAFFYLSLKEQNEMTHDQIAAFLGVSRQTVDNYILATELPEKVQEDIDADVIKISAALADYRQSHKKTKEEGAETVAERNHRLKKEEEAQMSGDEDEFMQEDNSIDSAGTRGGPKEERSSGETVIGKDSIYMNEQKKALWRQFINRFEVLTNTCLGQVEGDIDKAQEMLIERLQNEYILQVK